MAIGGRTAGDGAMRKGRICLRRVTRKATQHVPQVVTKKATALEAPKLREALPKAPGLLVERRTTPSCVERRGDCERGGVMFQFRNFSGVKPGVEVLTIRMPTPRQQHALVKQYPMHRHSLRTQPPHARLRQPF